MAVLVVLLLISITLALSYGVMRSQGTASQVHQNASLKLSARQAAMTGAAIALKQMQTVDWKGVDTTLAGSLSRYSGYRVRYTTGDPTLTPTHAEYSDLPYRVTLTSTGYIAAADDPQRQATHELRVVVRLVPRKLGPQPASWAEITKHSIYQYDDGRIRCAVPMQVGGTIRSYGKWDFPDEYYWSEGVQAQYFGDLNLMRQNGWSDYRPFLKQIALPVGDQSSDMLGLLNILGVPVADVTSSPPNDWSRPGALSSYRIYPGGKAYSIPTAPSYLWQTRLEPDPASNPLGIYCRAGQVDVMDQVSIRGTLVLRGTGSGDLFLWGRNLQLRPVDLPALYPTSVPVQLPLVVAEDDVRISGAATGSVQGVMAAWDEIEIYPASQEEFGLQLACKLVTRDLFIRGRTEWYGPPYGPCQKSWWGACYDTYRAQSATGIRYFPDWLKRKTGLDYAPRIVIQADSGRTFHYPWKDPSSPIFVPHPDDGGSRPEKAGLRWEVVQWIDNPPAG